ncbi:MULTISPECIES: hypothetical protein [Streptomyces]|uniref:hypothetical protein n=1 Tax=Streptomyces TaxID=1883 RepID=UPI00345BA686
MTPDALVRLVVPPGVTVVAVEQVVHLGLLAGRLPLIIAVVVALAFRGGLGRARPSTPAPNSGYVSRLRASPLPRTRAGTHPLLVPFVGHRKDLRTTPPGDGSPRLIHENPKKSGR